jgi:hypothetical protein
MRVVRRAHLFAGLFLVPWVVLYGVTGFLFNHPDAFPNQEVRAFGAAEIQGTALEGLPGPADLAAQVVAALHAEWPGRADYRLAHPEQAAYSGDQVLALARGGGWQHAIRFDLTGRTGTVRSRPDGPAAEEILLTRGGAVSPDRPPPERFTTSLPVVLNRLGLPHAEVTLEEVPQLVFVLEAGGRLWRATYDLQSGAVRGVPLASPEAARSARRFLTGLHLAHGYPAGVSAGWFWAVLVDVMFVAMVFWAGSGILMWWQIKALRRWGAVVLALSGAAAAALAVGMTQGLTP